MEESSGSSFICLFDNFYFIAKMRNSPFLSIIPDIFIVIQLTSPRLHTPEHINSFELLYWCHNVVLWKHSVMIINKLSSKEMGAYFNKFTVSRHWVLDFPSCFSRDFFSDERDHMLTKKHSCSNLSCFQQEIFLT